MKSDTLFTFMSYTLPLFVSHITSLEALHAQALIIMPVWGRLGQSTDWDAALDHATDFLSTLSVAKARQLIELTGFDHKGLGDVSETTAHRVATNVSLGLYR